MKTALILSSLILFSLNSLTADAQVCPSGNPQGTAYILREQPKRCEGIQASEISGSFGLISLTTGRIPSNSNPLRLEVPSSLNQIPTVKVRYPQKYYYLDPIEIPYKNNRFQIEWSNYVLRTEGIPFDSVYATAFVNNGSQIVYIPVILEKPSGLYNIVLWTNRRAKIIDFQIRRENQLIFQTSRPTFQAKGPISFPWDGRNLPAGRYQLLIKAELEQVDEPPIPATVNISFEHNPQWLK